MPIIIKRLSMPTLLFLGIDTLRPNRAMQQRDRAVGIEIAHEINGGRRRAIWIRCG